MAIITVHGDFMICPMKADVTSSIGTNTTRHSTKNKDSFQMTYLKKTNDTSYVFTHTVLTVYWHNKVNTKVKSDPNVM